MQAGLYAYCRAIWKVHGCLEVSVNSLRGHVTDIVEVSGLANVWSYGSWMAVAILVSPIYCCQVTIYSALQ